jgi:O-antigen/teichoic acid export membrane protein
MLLVQGVGILVALALSVVLARLLGVTEFGIYSYALSIATLLAVPVQLGLPTLIVRDTARLKQAKETRQMYRLWSWSTLAVLTASGAMIVPFWLLSPLLVNGSLTVPLLLLIFVLVPLMSLGALRAAALRGLGQIIQGQLPEMLFRPALILALVSASVPFLASGEMQASSALLVNVVATGLAFLAGLVLLRRVAPSPASGATPRSLHRHWMRAGIVFGLASSAMVVNRNLDTAMLGSMRPAAEVGLYKIAVNLSMLCATVMNMLQLALQPRIATLQAASRFDEMRSLASLAARISFAASVFLALVFLAYGRDIILLAFGTQYLAAYESMAILIAGQLANSFFGPVMMLLNMTGHEKIVMLSVIAAAVGNVVLNAVLIPLYGSIGAAIATAITLLAWNFLLYLQSLRLQGIDSSILGLHRENSRK